MTERVQTVRTGAKQRGRSAYRRMRRAASRVTGIHRMRRFYYERRLARFGDRPVPGSDRLAWAFYRLANARRRAGDDDGAIEAFRAAIACDDRPARFHYWLGFTLERAGGSSVQNVPRLGLVRAPGDIQAAKASYEAALERDPDNGLHWYRYGLMLERSSEHERAKDAFGRAAALGPDSPTRWYRYGRSILAVASQRGAFAPEEYEDANRAWARCLELEPDHLGARQHLARTNIRMERWADASRWSWYPEPRLGESSAVHALRALMVDGEVPTPALDAAEEVLRNPPDELGELPTEWWFPVHWRLLAAKRFTAAYAAKSIMAERVVRTNEDADDADVPRIIERARALAFLGRYDQAIDVVTTAAPDDAETDPARALRKVAADIDLLRGRVEDHVALLDLHRGANPPLAEERFRGLVSGRRVAVVGPAESELANGEEIDDYDVVIRTKYVGNGAGDAAHAPFCGTRTDLSYYAASSTGLFRKEIAAALGEGHMQMAVFRTMTFSPTADHVLAPGDLRFTPSEYQAGLRAIQFAIQRIIHDVLRYRPSEIKVFNINFFLAPKAYREGYNLGSTRLVAAQGLRRALSAFGHDFLSDFVFTQRMHRIGLVEVDPYVEQLLAMTPQEYLATMDATAAAEREAATS